MPAFMLTQDQLHEIMPKLPPERSLALLPHLNQAMAEYGIDSTLRVAAFVAQLAHESGEFRWMEEIWGPTAAQRRYEPESDLATRLGNTERGDGLRFKGRGPIQLTGRANYDRFGRVLGIDLGGAPERAAEPEVAFRIAALYWANRGLNELADAQDFREITRRINGGFNGLAERERYFERAKAVLTAGAAASMRRSRRGLGSGSIRRRSVPVERLTRGAETIREYSKRTAPSDAPATKARRARPTAAKKSSRKAGGQRADGTKAAVSKRGVKKRAGRGPATGGL